MPFDGSEYSEKAFEKTLEIAAKFESNLIAMTVIQSKISDAAGMSLERLEEIHDEEKDFATTIPNDN